MRTEREKMLAGKLYDPGDPELLQLRQKAHRLSAEYNATLETDEDTRKKILHELFPDIGEEAYLQ
jgi:maltose O-acetyltransferase